MQLGLARRAPAAATDCRGGARAALLAPRRSRPAAARRLTTRVLGFKPTYFPALEQQQQGRPAPGSSIATTDSTTTVLLPLDYYACLRLPRASGSRAVREALDCALNHPPPVGYSADTLSVRAVLLRSAADCLLDLRTRKGYDAMGSSMAGYTVEVSTQYLPGALVLLQESGHNSRVIELGAQWLSDNAHSDGMSADVAAAMALAHHELATQALQQDSGFVSEPCQHLETALLLLRRARRTSHSDASMAAQLQQEVLQLLEEFSPQCCLELLALPLADPQRRHGHLLLRKLVLGSAPELSPLGQDRDAFLQYARACMTPQEYLDLHKGVPQRARSTEQQLDVALASVAVAFQQQQPLMMLAAARAYDALERAIAKERAASSSDSSPDVCVCRASVALLLGNTPAAMQLLGLGEGSSRPPRQDVQEFVLEHSPDASDLLPGVFALAQCWLNEAVLGSFRDDEAQAPVELAGWFNAWHVRLCIMVLTAATRLRQWVIMAAGSLQQLRALPAAVAASMVWLQQRKQAARAGAVASSTASNRSAPSLPLLDVTAAAAEAPTGQLLEAEAQQTQRQPLRADRPRSRAQRARPKSPVLQRLEADRLLEQHDQNHDQPPPAAAAEAGAAGVQAPKVQRPAATAGMDEEEHSSNPFLVSSARLAADRSSSRLGGGGARGVDDADEDEEEEDEADREAVRARLRAQMQNLEAQMWDAPPEDEQPAWWARKGAMLALGAALVVAVAARGAAGRSGVGSADKAVSVKARVTMLREQP